MKLIALLLGLTLERLATHLLHLRELRWFDSYFDVGALRMGDWPKPVATVAALCVLALPVLPVLFISIAFQDVLRDVLYFAFAVVVLLFSLGPRDLATETEELARALEAEDEEASERIAVELLEGRMQGATPSSSELAAGVFVQATNRLFGVVFWFIVFGPVGAWAFRVSDLFRRRIVFEATRGGASVRYSRLIEEIHGVLSFVPARLAALGYALSGSYDHAVDRWREFQSEPGTPFFQVNDAIAAAVGCGALGEERLRGEAADAARGALQLVRRTLFIWLTVIALMTLFGWAV